MNEIIKYTNQFWELVLRQFSSSDSRLFWVYLSSSFLIALVVVGLISYKKNGKISFYSLYREVFDKKIWTHKSAVLDYKVFLLNILLMGVFVFPFFVSAVYVMDGTKNQLLIWFGEREYAEGSNFLIVVFYTLVLWLVSDFSRFFVHFLLHKIPFLWKFHELHHSAEVLTPVTQYRTHPVEMFLFYLRGVFVIGIISGIFLYYYPFQFGIIGVFGVNIFRFLFLFIGSNLRHSHVPMKFPKIIEYIFISPYQHQIHHSNKQIHFDKNYGSHLAIWDWMFSSLVLSRDVEKVDFGIPEGNVHKTLSKAYFLPFVRVFKKK